VITVEDRDVDLESGAWTEMISFRTLQRENFFLECERDALLMLLQEVAEAEDKGDLADAVHKVKKTISERAWPATFC
jgi:hypothetical protein